MDLELISFNICPFVQRSVITLLYKDIPHRITYIDLVARPDWFAAISPLGKVPVLRVDGKTAIFESAVINEFIDEVTPNQLMPADPLKRALHRGWIEFCSGCLVSLFMALIAKTEEDHVKHLEALGSSLDQIEAILENEPFFDGDQPSLIDFAYAPLFSRLELINQRAILSPLDRVPKISRWSQVLLQMDALKDSVLPDFEDLFFAYIEKQDSYSAGLYRKN